MITRATEIIDAVTVKDYLATLNATLTSQGAKIIGEVTECKPWNGHVYFSLKDETGDAILNCTMWRTGYTRSGIELENGMEVLITGIPNVYAKNGKLSFIANTLELVGEGALKKQYEKLKVKLGAEGLFEIARKRELPLYPKNIGVITSTTGGVVIYDYSSNLKRFGFVSKIVDSRVEGPDAVKEILDSIKTLKNQNLDVLVIIRGGGSLESFSAFNNERVVREVASFPVPVIVGVGHHVDICLAGLVADKMVSTPTAVANLLNESWDRATYEFDRHQENLINKYTALLADKKYEIQHSSSVIKERFNTIFETFRESEKILTATLYKFSASIQAKKDQIRKSTEIIFRLFTDGIDEKRGIIKSQWKDRVLVRFQHHLSHVFTMLEHNERNILQNNPERQLRLGYSIIKLNNRVVRSVKNIEIGDEVVLRLSDGEAVSKIKNITL